MCPFKFLTMCPCFVQLNESKKFVLIFSNTRRKFDQQMRIWWEYLFSNSHSMLSPNVAEGFSFRTNAEPSIIIQDTLDSLDCFLCSFGTLKSTMSELSPWDKSVNDHMTFRSLIPGSFLIKDVIKYARIWWDFLFMSWLQSCHCVYHAWF